MQFKNLVRPEHLNHHGYLFGGYMLQWVDEYAYITAMEDFPGGCFLTRAMEAASFSESVSNGDVLTFEVVPERIGISSVTYSVSVTARDLSSTASKEVFSIKITMCNTDGKGRKAPLPPRARQ